MYKVNAMVTAITVPTLALPCPAGAHAANLAKGENSALCSGHCSTASSPGMHVTKHVHAAPHAWETVWHVQH